MQTHIHPNLKPLPEIQDAEAILRSCVHCGFCTAVCPTYQELGDDLDSPRGRIYLIKNLLEEDSLGEHTHEHLDRCLTCRSCETTCPSGVEYGRLLEISKGLLQTRYSPKRSVLKRVQAFGLRQLLTRPRVFAALYQLGWWLRPILPGAIQRKMPPVHFTGPAAKSAASEAPAQGTVLLLQGCVQRSLTPGVNRAIETLLARQGMAVRYLSAEGCCGAVDYHLGKHDVGLARMRMLLDKLHGQLDAVSYIVSSASGCGVTLKDYPALFANEPEYREKAEAVAAKLKDISEIVSGSEHPIQPVSVAIQNPCTLQHGQKLPHQVENILRAAGAKIVPVQEPHLCCGSAGTYSVLEPELATRLGQRKVKNLTEHAPDVVVTANVGCQTHLSALADTPVMHWAEFLASYRK
ncbi:MAG: glycolate oxidase subunit GlcF [Pseudomonadales bacterium]